MATGAVFSVCLPESGPEFVAVAVPGAATGAQLAAAVGDAFSLSPSRRLTLELRSAGPLRPTDGGSDVLWAAAAPIGDGDVPEPGFVVGRTHDFHGPAAPAPPPQTVFQKYGRLDKPHVYVLLPEDGPSFGGVLLGHATDGAGLKNATAKTLNLSAERRGTLELRLAGPLWPHESMKRALQPNVWDALPVIRDDDPVPDRERGLVHGCYILGRTSKYYRRRELPAPEVRSASPSDGVFGRTWPLSSVVATIRSWRPWQGVNS
ncbi:hypothetical protein DFJ74DRAFT_439300 [Hyaloraphidium curvatum]|nr:hypothetical protein DFJ74DRAFT_439300 [Hyaloraphidium curvatum]